MTSLLSQAYNLGQQLSSLVGYKSETVKVSSSSYTNKNRKFEIFIKYNSNETEVSQKIFKAIQGCLDSYKIDSSTFDFKASRLNLVNENGTLRTFKFPKQFNAESFNTSTLEESYAKEREEKISAEKAPKRVGFEEEEVEKERIIKLDGISSIVKTLQNTPMNFTGKSYPSLVDAYIDQVIDNGKIKAGFEDDTAKVMLLQDLLKSLLNQNPAFTVDANALFAKRPTRVLLVLSNKIDAIGLSVSKNLMGIAFKQLFDRIGKASFHTQIIKDLQDIIFTQVDQADQKEYNSNIIEWYFGIIKTDRKKYESPESRVDLLYKLTKHVCKFNAKLMNHVKVFLLYGQKGEVQFSLALLSKKYRNEYLLDGNIIGKLFVRLRASERQFLKPEFKAEALKKLLDKVDFSSSGNDFTGIISLVKNMKFSDESSAIKFLSDLLIKTANQNPAFKDRLLESGSHAIMMDYSDQPSEIAEFYGFRTKEGKNGRNIMGKALMIARKGLLD